MSEKPSAGDPRAWIEKHTKQYQQDPEKAHLWDATLGGGKGMIPTLLLISKGRKSGTPRPSPLIYGQDGKNFVIIASKGGAPEHPAWYLNLVANPDCEIQVGVAHFKAKARTASGAERDRLWAKLVDIYAPYTDYQKRTARQIPVVVLEPQR